MRRASRPIGGYVSLYAMQIRFGTRDDAERIAALQTESWLTAYTGIMPDGYLNGPLLDERRALWTARLGTAAPEPDRAPCLLIVGDDTTLLGFAYLTPGTDGRLLLDNLHVQPGLKRSGIGRRLMRHAFAWAAAQHPGKAVYLEVLRDNTPAIAFYRSLGGHLTKEFVEHFPAGFALPVVEYTWTPDTVSASSWAGM